MDHLYIHAIVSEAYQSLHTGFEFSQSQLRQLQQILGSVDCLAPQAPDHILCFFALKTGEASLVRVFSKVQRQTNCASRGQMVQCLGWDLKDRSLPEDFPSMLRQEFYTQEEVEAQARQGSEVPLPQREGRAPEPVSIDPQVRYAILCTLVRRWLRREPALQIAVPEGKDYDGYVLGALEAIYSFLPTALGLEAGAVSYLPDSHVCPDRFYLGFVPAARADSRTLFLDGSAPGATQALSRGIRQDLDDFLSHVSSLEGQVLQDYLRQVYEEIEKHRLTQVTAMDYGPLGQLQPFFHLDGSLEEKLPQWLAFYRGWRRYPPISRSQVSKAIQGSISVPEFCSLYGRFCEKEDPVQCLDRLGTYGPLCRENPELTQGLRQVLLDSLQKKGLSPRKIYDMVSRAQILLLPMFPGPVLDRLYGQAMEDSIRRLQAMPLETNRDLETGRRQADLLLQQIGSSGRKNTEGLEQKLHSYEKKLRTLEDRILEQKFLSRLEQIRQQPGTTVEEIRNQTDQAGELLTQLTDHSGSSVLGSAEQAIRQFLQERTKTGSGSAARLSQLRLDLDRAPGYFEKLEAAAAWGDLLADPGQKKAAMEEISRVRPRSLSVFKEQYRQHYGRPMTLEAMGELPDLVSGQILRDLGSFRSLTVNLKGRNLSRQRMLERMAVMEKRAQGLDQIIIRDRIEKGRILSTLKPSHEFLVITQVLIAF